MIVASRKTVGKRLLPLLLAMVFLLLSLPESAFAASVSAVVTADVMAVYADPGLSRQVGTLEGGEVVAVDRTSGGVAYFRYLDTGGSGYARTADMQPLSDVAEQVRVQASGARFYREMDTSSQYKSVSAGSTVYLISVSGDWARVARNGLGGYMLVDDLYGQQDPAPTQQPSQGPLQGFTRVNMTATAVSDTLTVYTSPDTGASTVGTLPKGARVSVTYRSDDWAYITCSGRSGFAPLRYLLPGDPVTVETVAAVSKGQVPVYETASTADTRLTTLAAGEEVTVIARNSAMACVRTEDNVTGYVLLSGIERLSGQIIAPTATPAPSQGFEDAEGVITETVPAVAIADTYVYKSPSTSSENQGVLAAGKQVTVLMRTNTWAYITAQGKYGFCNLHALQRLESSATQTPTVDLSGFKNVNMAAVAVTQTSVYAQASSGAQAVSTLSAGAAVTVTAYSDDWAYIGTGFVPLKCVMPDASCEVRTRTGIVVRETTVYETASTSAAALGRVARGDVLTVLAYGSTWAYVRSAGGSEGYMNLAAIVPYEGGTATPAPTAAPTIPAGEGTPATVVVDKLDIYGTPSTSGEYLGSVRYGTQLTVLDQNGTWAMVTLDGGVYGYCLLSGLKANSQFEGGTPATVTVDFLTVYRSASTGSAVLTTIKRGDQVTVVDHNGTWAYVRSAGGNYGFCQLAGLTPTSQVQPEPDDDTVKYAATVIYPKAPFFQSASEDSAYVTVSAGTDVNVYKYDAGSGWGYVGIGDQRGYMLLKHLNKNSYATLSDGSSGAAVLVLQQALEKMGYFDGAPAGNYSSLTKTAVARFQSAVGLSATGTADQTTQRVLYGGYAPESPLLSLTLTNGSTGENVTRLQTRLYYKGYLSKASSVDGDYGSTTASAVKLFQTAAGLSATGTADAATLRALYSNNAPKNPSTAPDAGSGGGGSSSGGGDSSQDHLPDNPTRAEKIEYVIYVAQQQLGKPYVYGASGTSKYDCSGLTLYCYKQVGVSLPHSAQMQGYNSGTKIEGLDNLQRGDIVCMNTVSDSDLSDHVGIYLGNKKMIHASSGAGEVIISDLSEGYYNRVFSWGRRVL